MKTAEEIYKDLHYSRNNRLCVKFIDVEEIKAIQLDAQREGIKIGMRKAAEILYKRCEKNSSGNLRWEGDFKNYNAILAAVENIDKEG